jgi:hypothetical protein
VSTAVIIQFAAIALLVVLGAFVVSAIFEMRGVYAKERAKFVRGMNAIEEFRKLEPKIMAVLQRVESETQTLARIGQQVEEAVAALKNSSASSEKPVETITPDLPCAPAPQPAPVSPQAPKANADYVRLRKEVVGNDAQLRFSVLSEWVSINTLAIKRRASRGWTTPSDLIANVPAYLEPEAEITDERILLVGTRGHPQKVAISLNDPDLTTHEVISRRTDV